MKNLFKIKIMFIHYSIYKLLSNLDCLLGLFGLKIYGNLLLPLKSVSLRQFFTHRPRAKAKKNPTVR